MGIMKQKGRKKIPEDKHAFYQGVASVLGFIIKEHDEPSLALDYCISHGITASDFNSEYIDKFDLDAIQKAFA